VRITCLIAALLLKLTRCSTSVTQLFSRWGEFVEQHGGIGTEAEDEIYNIKKVCELYSRSLTESPTLSVRALKTLLKLQHSDILKCILE
jgi:hypothetical protein